MKYWALNLKHSLTFGSLNMSLKSSFLSVCLFSFQSSVSVLDKIALNELSSIVTILRRIRWKFIFFCQGRASILGEEEALNATVKPFIHSIQKTEIVLLIILTLIIMRARVWERMEKYEQQNSSSSSSNNNDLWERSREKRVHCCVNLYCQLCLSECRLCLSVCLSVVCPFGFLNLSVAGWLDSYRQPGSQSKDSSRTNDEWKKGN